MIKSALLIGCSPSSIIPISTTVQPTRRRERRC
jgi:hypothetical protein